MSITKLSQKYSEFFTTSTRTNGIKYVFLKDNAPEELKEAIREAHGDSLPSDFTYGTFADLLGSISGYDIESESDFEDVRAEIVDSQVDIYTKGLTEWLDSDISNVYYLEEAQKQFGEITDGFRLLSTAQYIAIDEIMQFVYDFLVKQQEEEEEEEEE